MLYLSAVRAQARNFANKFIKNERGVTAIEYAVVAAGVSAVVLAICLSVCLSELMILTFCFLLFAFNHCLSRYRFVLYKIL